MVEMKKVRKRFDEIWSGLATLAWAADSTGAVQFESRNGVHLRQTADDDFDSARSRFEGDIRYIWSPVSPINHDPWPLRMAGHCIFLPLHGLINPS